MAAMSVFLYVCAPAYADDHQLPDQPKDPEGGYVVLWDCNADGGRGAFASANTMEYNETFIIAVNLHGTALGEWVMAQPTAPQYTRGIVLNMMRDDQGNEYADSGARLWHIRDTIFGATVNFKQLRMKNGGANNNPGNNQRTEIHARLFGHETAFGPCASSITTQSNKNWWQWSDGGANGWPSSGSWTHGYIHRSSNNYFFRFASFTGTKSATNFTTTSSDDVHNQWWDKDHRVTANGFASPFGSASPCPMTYPEDFSVSASRTDVCATTHTGATITLSGSESGYTYTLYKDGQEVSGSATNGTGNALQWFNIEEAGTYTVWASENGGSRRVQMTPCSGASSVTLTSNNCCLVNNVTITVSPRDGKSGTPLGQCDTITVTAAFTGATDVAKTYRWEVHGSGNDAKWKPTTVEELGDGKATSQIKLTYEDFRAAAGDVQMGNNRNNGYYTIWIYVDDPDCNNKVKQAQYQILLTDAPCPHCPTFTWSIDGQEGVDKPMYPGGWYDLSCTTPAGAPTITLTSGTGIEVGQPTTNGNTTTIRVKLTGDAAGAMDFKAVSPAKEAEGYIACEDVAHIEVSPCEGMTKDSYKIQWSNYESVPQYQILNGVPVYLRDNNGYLDADRAYTDGRDEWNLIATGETVANCPVYYIQNALTKKYLYRGSTHGNVNSTWEYVEALLGATNFQTVDYKWIFFQNPNNSNQTMLACIDGFVGDINNIKNGAYVIHNRNWEAPTLFSDPNLPSPRMVCGKTGDQGWSSPSFLLRNFIKTQVAASHEKTTLSWATAPAASVHMEQNDEATYTANRSDQIHSLNNVIWYESADPTVASVDPVTGKVTALVEDGETEIMAILGDTGCFLGDTLRYKVVIYSCGETPSISAEKTLIDKTETVQITITNPAKEGETVTWDFSYNDGGNASVTNAGVFSVANYGTYTFRYKITNTAHPDCNRESNYITIEAKEKQDYILPKQPKTADGQSYIVKWDCATNDFAASNDMEWDETFVFAVNLAGTPLGDWIMRGSGRPGVERSVAFDRFREKGNDATQFNPDASRLWHIRDTIFGATFNFAQIQYFNGNQFHHPILGEQTTIAARLFGFETAKGAKCDKAPTGNDLSGKWYEWSNRGTTQNQWRDEWVENKYVSVNDVYMFCFAPYTGTKTDAAIKAKDDDSRDQWWDGHYFDRAGYKMPCPKDWPADQAIAADKSTICPEESETAVVSIASSEAGWNYVLYQNGTEVAASSQAGTGASLSWTVDAIGTYTVQAVATDESSQHSDQMGTCAANKGTVSIAEHCDEPDPECPTIERLSSSETLCDTILEATPYIWTPYEGRSIECTKGGVYGDTIRCTLSNGVVCDSIIYTFTLRVIHCERPEEPQCEEVVFRKWNDVLVVDNHEDRYASYQWYKNGQKVQGATLQHYYVEGEVLLNDGNRYYCVIVCKDGSVVTSCEHEFAAFSTTVQASVQERHLTITPNPAVGPSHVQIQGVGDHIHCSIYTAAGKLVLTAEQTEIPVNLPAGCYMVRVIDDNNEVYTDKLIIR